MRNEYIDIPKDALSEHPAVQAWLRLRSSQVSLDGVAVLKEKSKSHVYRLAGAGPGGAAVIAKRCLLSRAMVERTIYEEVLPHLPISAPRYYACVEDPGGYCWLFMEDVGGERYSPNLAEHRVVVARWLGRMHGLSSRLGAALRLPDKGPAHYLAYLRSARTALQKVTNPALTASDMGVLHAIVSLCERLAARWDQLERFCAEMPRTLVHGDFVAKNVRVRTGRTGIEVVPFDWEKAGSGVPAPDLGQRAGSGFPNPDLTTYWSVVREHWSHLSMDDLRRQAELGKILRCLAGISWALPGLTFPSVEKAIAQMRVYRAEAIAAMQAAGLE